MELSIYPTNYERNRGNLTDLPVINFFVEEGYDGKMLLQSRPGLRDAGTVGTTDAPMRFVYSEPGVFSSDVFSVIGDQFYRGTDLLGTIDGDGPVSIDSYTDRLFLAAGASLWTYDGSTLTTVAVPDDQLVSKVFVGFGRAFLVIKDSDVFYWTDILDTVIDPLSFATAENSPDFIKDAIILGDSLILFGEATIEFWMVSANPDTPFEPLVGRVYPKGIKNLGAMAQVQSSFAAVTNTSQVFLGTPDNIVSSPELEIKIEEAGEVFLWTFYLDQKEFLCVSVGDENWIFNTRTKGLWSKFETYGLASWEPRYYTKGVFGSNYTNRFLEWSTRYEDSDAVTLERRFRAYGVNTNPSTVVHNVSLLCEKGTTTFTEGTYINPRIEMRISRDSGNTWSSWRSTNLGVQGDYRAVVRWLSCGIFGYNGFVFEFRVTDPVSVCVFGAHINEKYGGI